MVVIRQRVLEPPTPKPPESGGTDPRIDNRFVGDIIPLLVSIVIPHSTFHSHNKLSLPL